MPLSTRPSASRRCRSLSGWLALCLLLIGSLLPAGAGAVPLSLADPKIDQPLGPRIRFLQEAAAPLALDEARAALARDEFSADAKAIPAFGIGARPVWLHLAVINPELDVVVRRLLIENAWLDDVEVHFVERGRPTVSVRAGDRQPFAARPVFSRFFAIDHGFRPGETEIYLRVASPDPLVLPVFLLTPDAARDRERVQAYSYGAVYGFLIALLAYNAVLFTSLGDRRYLLYAIFLGAFVLLNAAYTGHGYAWLWSESPAIQQWIIPLLMVAFGVAGLRFARCFLDTRERTPRAHRLTGGLALLFVLGVIVAAVAGRDQTPALLVAFAFMTVFSVTMIALGINAWRARVTSSRYFLIAGVASMLGTATTALSVWGVLPYTDLGFRAAEFGMLADATLLALALGARFRFIELEKAISELSRSQLADRNQSLIVSLREVERLASTDRLTGLWNRLHVERAAAGEMDRATRYCHATSLLLFDIDHFKRVNDRFGHRAGDDVLIGLAAALRECLRETDVTARWGGEEFLVLLPNTALADAVQAAEKLRRHVARTLSTPDGQPVTISIGVAEWRGEGETLDAWVARADRVLYLAKENGRNRVEEDPLTGAATPREGRPLLQLAWSPRYESGIGPIDREHRALVEAANRVLALLPALSSPETVAEGRRQALLATEGLVRDVRAHFATEEAMLADIGWSELAAHRAEHARLLERALKLQDALRDGDPATAGMMVIDFLAREVVAAHILVDDRAYFAFASTASGGLPALDSAS